MKSLKYFTYRFAVMLCRPSSVLCVSSLAYVFATE